MADSFTNITTRVPNVDTNSAADINTLMANIRLGALRPWTTSTSYTVGQVVIKGYTIYYCISAHTSGTFATDFWTSSKWAPMTEYPGCVKIHPIGTKIPTAWAEMNGDTQVRATADVLYGLIGTDYGVGDGSTTFNLPDTENDASFIRHYKSGVSAAIATLQTDAFQGHGMGGTMGGANGLFIDFTQLRWGGVCNSGGFGASVLSIEGTGTNLLSMRGFLGDGVNGTPRTASETRPNNYAMKYIIKVL